MSSIQDIIHTNCERDLDKRREWDAILFKDVLEGQLKRTKDIVKAHAVTRIRDVNILFTPLTMDPSVDNKTLQYENNFNRLMELDAEFPEDGCDLKSKFFSVDSLERLPQEINPSKAPRYLRSILLPNSDVPRDFALITKCMEVDNGVPPEELTPSQFLQRMKDQIIKVNKVLQERRYKITSNIKKGKADISEDTLFKGIVSEDKSIYLDFINEFTNQAEYWQKLKFLNEYELKNPADLADDSEINDTYLKKAIDILLQRYRPIFSKKENNTGEKGGSYPIRKTRKQKRKN
jgi:hypothetical protein